MYTLRNYLINNDYKTSKTYTNQTTHALYCQFSALPVARAFHRKTFVARRQLSWTFLFFGGFLIFIITHEFRCAPSAQLRANRIVLKKGARKRQREWVLLALGRGHSLRLRKENLRNAFARTSGGEILSSSLCRLRGRTHFCGEYSYTHFGWVYIYIYKYQKRMLLSFPSSRKMFLRRGIYISWLEKCKNIRSSCFWI